MGWMILSCELLSKVYIFDIRNNIYISAIMSKPVVNCFQKFISLILETTGYCGAILVMGCELLSKVYIFDIRNNCICNQTNTTYVVNCFQKFISLILETTY